jgi:uncharacterized phiE125 gp8 family phage protein
MSLIPNKSINVKTAPATEPVTLDEAKLHLRVTCAADDAYITALIKAARRHAELYQGRSYITQTLELRMDFFPQFLIELPRPPSISVTSIKYIDSNGDTQTLDASKYTTDFNSYVARIVPAYNESWPTTRRVIDAVTIEYEAGYGAASDVPETIKQAIYLLLTIWYDNRTPISEATVMEIPFTVTALLIMEKVY